MRIIRPHGTSATGPDPDEDGRNRRVLRRKRTGPRDAEAVEDIPLFAATHDALVIGQWISTIDKIAAKPAGTVKPSEAQRALRSRLGAAAWAVIGDKGRLPGLADNADALDTLWKYRLHPYPDGVGKKGQRVRGRWYARFVGEGVKPAEADAEAVARRIDEHLHEREHPIAPGLPTREGGRIEKRAKSIARNAPSLATVARAAPDDAAKHARDAARETAWEAYAAAGDVARACRTAAEAIESDETPTGATQRRRWVGPDVAARELYAHWEKVFTDAETGAVLPAAEVRRRIDAGDTRLEALLAVHDEVRAVYRRRLKRHKRSRRDRSGGQPVSDVARTLPDSMARLRIVMDAKRTTRDVNALIRLGRVIHYEAAEPLVGAKGAAALGDTQAHVLDQARWPDDVRLKRSRFWTSDGQAEIKANEAFVRIWRGVLALMHRTASDWSGAQPKTDPIGREATTRALTLGKRFAPARYRQKLDLLFGKRADLFRGEDAFERRVLHLALDGLRQIRNRSFHFVGLGGFREALTQALGGGDPAARKVARALWEQDMRGRSRRIAQVLKAAHAQAYLDADELQRLFRALTEIDDQAQASARLTAPLPRFRRVLARAANIPKDAGDGEEPPRLPPAPGGADLEESSALCRYTALKLLYERPFRRWLSAEATADRFIAHLDAARRRADEESRRLSSEKDSARRALTTARAMRVTLPQPGEGYAAFFATVMSESISEMRVTKDYGSDKDAQREQSELVENLLREAVALAFLDYLQDAQLDFLLRIAPGHTIPQEMSRDPLALEIPTVNVEATEWQVALYLITHLSPVDDISLLLHQLRKFLILSGKRGGGGPVKELADDAARIIETFDLYLDMHDAKFAPDPDNGDSKPVAAAGLDDFAALFESPELFEETVARPLREDDGHMVPARGLREIARFGHFAAFRGIFETAKVTDDEVRRCAAFERETDGRSRIAKLHERRKELKTNWAKTRDKTRFPQASLSAYANTLNEISEHRRLANHIRLTNHVRVHRLAMTIAGRLLEFSGLYERDLYFATLALLREHGETPCAAFGQFLDPKGKPRDSRDLFEKGQILTAMQGLDDALRQELDAMFGFSGANRRIRNSFAHFGMFELPGREGAGGIDLTVAIDRARQLVRYDRRKRNAVAMAIRKRFGREKLDLAFTFNNDFCLKATTPRSFHAEHLGGAKVNGRDGEKGEILETLNGEEYLRMVAKLFGAAPPQSQEEVSIPNRPAPGQPGWETRSPRRKSPSVAPTDQQRRVPPKRRSDRQLPSGSGLDMFADPRTESESDGGSSDDPFGGLR